MLTFVHQNMEGDKSLKGDKNRKTRSKAPKGGPSKVRKSSLLSRATEDELSESEVEQNVNNSGKTKTRTVCISKMKVVNTTRSRSVTPQPGGSASPQGNRGSVGADKNTQDESSEHESDLEVENASHVNLASGKQASLVSTPQEPVEETSDDEISCFLHAVGVQKPESFSNALQSILQKKIEDAINKSFNKSGDMSSSGDKSGELDQSVVMDSSGNDSVNKTSDSSLETSITQAAELFELEELRKTLDKKIAEKGGNVSGSGKRGFFPIWNVLLLETLALQFCHLQLLLSFQKPSAQEWREQSKRRAMRQHWSRRQCRQPTMALQRPDCLQVSTQMSG